MPQIDAFNGIKILIYNGDHRPPHIHATYGEYEILIVIKSGQIYAGDLPSKQLKMVFDWLAINADEALHIFYQLNRELQ